MADESKDDKKEVDKGSGIPGGQIITINVGGCGVALGQSLNEQYCLERGISSDGSKKDKSPYDDTLNIQFEEGSKGKHDAASIFPCAHYTMGKELIEPIQAQIKNLVDACDKLQGFVVNHSLTGGCGTGLTALILERLSADYSKKAVAVYTTMHDETFLSHPTQSYNGILMMKYLDEYCDYAVVTDNKALYGIVQNNLKIRTPRFRHFNGLLNKLYSGITMPARYNVNNSNLLSISRELVPIPRLKYLQPSFWPILPKSKDNKPIIFKNDAQSLVNQSVQGQNFMVLSPDFDVEEDHYLSIGFNFRGKIDKDKALEALKWIKTNKKVSISMYGEPIKKDIEAVQFHDSAPNPLPTDDLIDLEAQVTMIGNNTSINRMFNNRLSKIYDLLYSQRAYVHHYVGEGMDEKEFSEARSMMGFLEKDYLDSLSEKNNDQNEDD